MAAEEFTLRGYHSTRVEHIAERLDVTPGALYRHVPGKYEMFRDAVAALVSELESAAQTVDCAQSDTPTVDPADPDALAQMVAATTRTTLTHRPRAALYRWQARYLTAEDRAAVVAADARVRRRFAEAVRGRRRGGPAAGAGSAAGAILSCIASLGNHRIEISESDAVALTTSIAGDLAWSVREIPTRQIPPAPVRPAPAAQKRLRGGAATREGAIEAAIARFHSSGYDSVTMEAIGADVGVAASALYRHFSGKSALLTAAVDRTAVLVEELLDHHATLHSQDADPAGYLVELLDQYVAIAFSHGPELMLYHSELGCLDDADRRRLRRSQRDQLDRWAGLVLDAARARTRTLRGEAETHWIAAAEADKPEEPDDATARIRVHASLAVVLDGGQGSGFDPAAAARLGELARIPLLPT